MRCRFYVGLLFFLLVSPSGFSQNVPVNIQVLSKTKANGVWLRWAPTNAAVWALGNKYGYKISHIDKMCQEEICQKILSLQDTEAMQEMIVNEMEKDVNRLKLVSDRFGKIGSRPQLEPP